MELPLSDPAIDNESQPTPSPACGGGLGWGLFSEQAFQNLGIAGARARITSILVGGSKERSPAATGSFHLMAQRSQQAPAPTRPEADKAAAPTADSGFTWNGFAVSFDVIPG